MAEIAIISQDFCTLLEAQTQEIPIDFKSVSPEVLAKYSLGPKNSEMQSWSYDRGFLKKVSVIDTKTGTLKISRTNPTNDVTFETAVLDMDGNRVINVGDAFEGDVNNSAGAPGHAVNLKIGDRRFLRKESWSPESERTMFSDLLFNGSLAIKNISDNGILTINGGYSLSNARIVLNSQQSTISIDTGVLAQEAVTVNTTATTINSTALTINNTSNVNNFTGNLVLNPNLQTRIQNIRSVENYNTIAGTTIDNDALTVKDFKRHQRGQRLNPDATNAVNVYKQTVNGVHQFRRVVGGTNINVSLNGDDVVITNTMPLGLTVIGRNASGGNLTNEQIRDIVQSVFPAANLTFNTTCRVSVEYPSNATLNNIPVSVSFSPGVRLTEGRSISRTFISGVKWTGSSGPLTGTGTPNQPTFGVASRVTKLYRVEGSPQIWVFKQNL